MVADTKNRIEDGPRGAFLLGAFHDLPTCVDTNLFVICPNHSGSSFLQYALAASRRTWNLPGEGGSVPGFVGPSRVNDGRLADSWKIWMARRRWSDVLRDPAAYDWPRNRSVWYSLAYARDPGATIFVEKTARHLRVVGDLVRHFRNARFLFMVRNPYAVCEGICRRLRSLGRSPSFSSHRPPPSPPALEGERLETVVARHVANCLELQRRNVEAFGAHGRFFTYETMCAEPERAARTIRELVPALDDLNLRRRLAVKKRYREMLTDMNARQIGRLDCGALAAINRVFRRHGTVLDHFGYELMDSPAEAAPLRRRPAGSRS